MSAYPPHLLNSFMKSSTNIDMMSLLGFKLVADSLLCCSRRNLFRKDSKDVLLKLFALLCMVEWKIENPFLGNRQEQFLSKTNNS